MADEIRAIFRVTGPDQFDQELVVTPAGMLVGRTRDNGLLLPHNGVSRQHLRLYIEGDAIYVIDLDSRNGTFLNDTLLATQTVTRVAVSDRLLVGPFTLTLREIILREPAAEPEPEPEKPPLPRSRNEYDPEPKLERSESKPPPRPAGAAKSSDIDANVKRTLQEEYRFGEAQSPPAESSVEEAPAAEVLDDLLAFDDDEVDDADGFDAFEAEESAGAEPPEEADESVIFDLPTTQPGSAVPPPPPPIQQPIVPPQALEPEAASKRRDQVSPTRTGGSLGSSMNDALKEAQQAQFSAYYPREMRPDDWQPLQAYVFKAFAAEKVAADAEKQIGPLSQFRRILTSARKEIPEGALITAQPLLSGFQFNPPTVTVGFYEDWHRFEFKLRAKDAPLNQAANGLLTFTVNGIIVADIPLSVFVTNEATQTMPQASAPQPMYDTIFASYSHRDMQIVERVEAAAKALGMTYLRDVITLRSGQHWSDELLKMIDQATIFQLFWSETAAQSPYCQQEWEYALKLNRDNQYFIRPVYWMQPMPHPPTNLQHLHFAYQPDLVK